MTHAGGKTRTIVFVFLTVTVLCCIGIAIWAVTANRSPQPETTAEVEQAPASAEETPPAPAPEQEATIDTETQVVAESIRTAEEGWASHITGVETRTMLRRPVIVVSTDIGPEQAGLSDVFSSDLASFIGGLSSPDGAPYTYYVQILSSEGDMLGSIGLADERWALDTPPVPWDADSLYTWLDQVYGSGSPSPEAWFNRITSVDSGSGGHVVIRTDLDQSVQADLACAQTIIDAVNSSGATFSTEVRVIFGDGKFEWSSLLDGIDPYSP
ncbi:MAG: hypothetical protein JXA36_03535 [Coriobacteriia bacterium]|nr:hypothetical protein [Coriobacteriia bacterium]